MQTTPNSAAEPDPEPVGPIVRHRRHSRLAIRIPIGGEGPDARAAQLKKLEQEGEPSEAEVLRERCRNTSPQGREIIRKKLYAFTKALRKARDTVREGWAAIQKLFPEPMLDGLSPKGTEPIPDEICEQAASHLKKTGQTGAYLAAVERLSTAYDVLKRMRMPQNEDEAQRMVFFGALADKLQQPAPEASPQPAPDSAGELLRPEAVAQEDDLRSSEGEHEDAVTIHTPPQEVPPRDPPAEVAQFGMALKRLSELLRLGMIPVPDGQTSKVEETEAGYIRAAQYLKERHNESVYLQAQEQLAGAFAQVSRWREVAEHAGKVAFHERVASYIRKNLAKGAGAKEAGRLSCPSPSVAPDGKEAPSHGPAAPQLKGAALARAVEPAGQRDTGVTTASVPTFEQRWTGVFEYLKENFLACRGLERERFAEMLELVSRSFNNWAVRLSTARTTGAEQLIGSSSAGVLKPAGQRGSGITTASVPTFEQRWTRVLEDLKESFLACRGLEHERFAEMLELVSRTFNNWALRLHAEGNR